MSRLTIILFISLVIISLFVRCSDDEKPLEPTPAPQYLILGSAVIRPYIDFMGSIHPINGQVNNIDSILIGDSACSIEKTGSYVEGNNYNYNFSYFNPDDSLRFHSGDTAEIKIVMGNEIAAVRLKLVALPEDSIHIMDPPQSSSVPLSANLPIVWRKVANADWYSIYYIYDTSSAFDADLRQVYDYAIDTTYVIPGTELLRNGNLRFFVEAVSGPVPGFAGNISSTSMTGCIYSWAIPGVRYGWNITVGSGLPGFERSQSITLTESDLTVQYYRAEE